VSEVVGVTVLVAEGWFVVLVNIGSVTWYNAGSATSSQVTALIIT
jgi:hypothetical protein